MIVETEQNWTKRPKWYLWANSLTPFFVNFMRHRSYGHRSILISTLIDALVINHSHVITVYLGSYQNSACCRGSKADKTKFVRFNFDSQHNVRGGCMLRTLLNLRKNSGGSQKTLKRKAGENNELDYILIEDRLPKNPITNSTDLTFRVPLFSYRSCVCR